MNYPPYGKSGEFGNFHDTQSESKLVSCNDDCGNLFSLSYPDMEVPMNNLFAIAETSSASQDVNSTTHRSLGNFAIAKSLNHSHGYIFPKQSDAKDGGEVPGALAISLKCLLRCLFHVMPFERLGDKMTKVTKDPDRFAARYLKSFYRQGRACGMILEDGIDRALGLVCLEQWLCTMLANQSRNGFNLPNFALSPTEINSISRCAWCSCLCVHP